MDVSQVNYWYDRSDRTWVVQCLAPCGQQVGPGLYMPTKLEALALARVAAKKYGASLKKL